MVSNDNEDDLCQPVHECSDVQFPGFGLGTAIVICWLPCAVLYKTLTSRLCKDPRPARRWSELQLMHRTLPWAILWSSIAAVLLEGRREVRAIDAGAPAAAGGSHGTGTTGTAVPHYIVPIYSTHHTT